MAMQVSHARENLIAALDMLARRKWLALTILGIVIELPRSFRWRRSFRV